MTASAQEESAKGEAARGEATKEALRLTDAERRTLLVLGKARTRTGQDVVWFGSQHRETVKALAQHGLVLAEFYHSGGGQVVFTEAGLELL